MINRLVAFSLAQPFLVIVAAIALMIWGRVLLPKSADRRLS